MHMIQPHAGSEYRSISFQGPKVKAQKSRGVALIEVLIAIVLSAIGLLALAGVNAASVRYTKMSQYKATATLLASDIGERMRANKAGFVAASYDLATEFATQTASAPTAPAELCDTKVSACTAAQLAAADMYQWTLLVRDQLPEGSVTIVSNNQGADVYVVWRDPAVASTDDQPTGQKECPDTLNVAVDPLNPDDPNRSVRCAFFRVILGQS